MNKFQVYRESDIYKKLCVSSEYLSTIRTYLSDYYFGGAESDFFNSEFHRMVEMYNDLSYLISYFDSFIKEKELLKIEFNLSMLDEV